MSTNPIPVGAHVATPHGPARVVSILRTRIVVRYDTPRPSRRGPVSEEKVRPATVRPAAD